MRKLMLLAVVIVAGCGSRPLDAVDDQTAMPDWGTNLGKLEFRRDDRPADGPLVEVILTRNERGTYDAVKHTVSSGFGGPVEDKAESIAQGLSCANTLSAEQSFDSARCFVDTRPVDGPLVEIFFTRNSEYRYRIRIVVTPSGFGGDTTPRTTDLGDGFSVVKAN
jgi:hypothetical protein